MYNQAIAIYNDLLDMDYQDYEDTREQDIQHIMNLLQTIGEPATRALLTTM